MFSISQGRFNEIAVDGVEAVLNGSLLCEEVCTVASKRVL